MREADAIVLCGTALALRFLSHTASASLWARALVLLDVNTELAAEEVERLRTAGAVLTADSGAAQVLKQAGLRPWLYASQSAGEGNHASAALALAQPLSLVLGGGGRAQVLEPQKIAGGENKDRRVTLPVWLYWEGECADRIKACRQTIFAHAADVRLLTPETFAQLWDVDRDIDLTKLHVAHRADFIRALSLIHI